MRVSAPEQVSNSRSVRVGRLQDRRNDEACHASDWRRRLRYPVLPLRPPHSRNLAERQDMRKGESKCRPRRRTGTSCASVRRAGLRPRRAAPGWCGEHESGRVARLSLQPSSARAWSGPRRSPETRVEGRFPCRRDRMAHCDIPIGRSPAGMYTSIPSPRGGSGMRSPRFPAATFAQYPRGGCGMSWRAQSLASATSEKPKRGAIALAGSAHIRS